MNQVRSITVVGGGTSGLVAALTIKTINPDLDVQVIESSKIEIVGVGEGTTEHWFDFMDLVGISVFEIIAETDATFKTGVLFQNWDGNNGEYMHCISDTLNVPINEVHGTYAKMIADKVPPASREFLGPAAECVHYPPWSHCVYQYHFNTFKLNKLLRKHAKLRNIDIIDDEISHPEFDERGNVSKLVSKTNKTYTSDIYIDGTGFKRLLIGQMGAKWHSVGKNLPVNASLAFPTALEDNEVLPSYTLCKAMDYGWMWRSPTQQRYGNGYVYNKDFITDDDALAEAQKHFKQPLQVAKNIKFDPGHLDKFWINNCIALGLSAGFVEPLEASNIATTINQSFHIARTIKQWHSNPSYVEKCFNDIFLKANQRTVDYIQLHYFTQRRDTKFWEHCANLELTEFNKETLDIFKDSLPRRAYFTEPYLIYRELNWLLVMNGNGLIRPEKAKQAFESLTSSQQNYILSVINNANNYANNNKGYTHADAIADIINHSGVNVGY